MSVITVVEGYTDLCLTKEYGGGFDKKLNSGVSVITIVERYTDVSLTRSMEEALPQSENLIPTAVC